MKTLDSYRLLITPLSPVHVGTGESYEPTNYVIDDGVLHEFDTGAAMQALTEKDRAKLLEIGNRKPNPEMIEALQRFFHERRSPLMGHAVQRIPVLSGVAGLYAKRIGQTANREADGKKVVNRLEIDRTSFNPVTRLPVLFGSSIKGAIRTALLNHTNDGSSLQKVEDRRTGRRRDENNLELQQRLFQYRAGKFELDPMRLIQLADAFWNGEPGVPAVQIHLAVNRKKMLVKDKQGLVRASMAESKELYQILECVPGWHYRAFSSQLNIQSVAGLDSRHRDKLPAAELRFDARALAQACNAFYLPILKDEIQTMRERGYVSAAWDKAIQQIMSEYADRPQKGHIFLLRVGRHSGAESVTLNGVRSIKIMGGKGADGRNQSTNAATAKTLWLAAEDKDQMQNLLPFGWLLVEVHDMNAAPADWPELRATCEPYLASGRQFAEQLKTKETEIEQARRDADSKRLAEAEEARRQAEEDARQAQAETERQARLATLSPNQRQVEEFIAKAQARKVQLGSTRERPNTGIHSQAGQLAKTALEGADWTAEEKRTLAEAIETWLPQLVERLDKKDDWKEARKKLKLAALKGEA